MAEWVGHAQALPGAVAGGGAGLAQRRGHRGQAAVRVGEAGGAAQGIGDRGQIAIAGVADRGGPCLRGAGQLGDLERTSGAVVGVLGTPAQGVGARGGLAAGGAFVGDGLRQGRAVGQGVAAGVVTDRVEHHPALAAVRLGHQHPGGAAIHMRVVDRQHPAIGLGLFDYPTRPGAVGALELVEHHTLLFAVGDGLQPRLVRQGVGGLADLVVITARAAIWSGHLRQVAIIVVGVGPGVAQRVAQRVDAVVAVVADAQRTPHGRDDVADDDVVDQAGVVGVIHPVTEAVQGPLQTVGRILVEIHHAAVAQRQQVAVAARGALGDGRTGITGNRAGLLPLPSQAAAGAGHARERHRHAAGQHQLQLVVIGRGGALTAASTPPVLQIGGRSVEPVAEIGRCTDPEVLLVGVARAIDTGHYQGRQARHHRVGLGIGKFSGVQVDRITRRRATATSLLAATIAAVRRVWLRWRCVVVDAVAGAHGLVQRHTAFRGDARAVAGHPPLPVHPPTFGWVVNPEIGPCAGGQRVVVRVQDLDPLRRLRRQRLHRGSARFQGEVHRVVARHRERGAVDRRRHDGEVMHQRALAVTDHRAGRNVDLQARHIRMGEHHILFQRRGDGGGVAGADTRQVHRVGQPRELPGLQLDADHELAVLTPGRIGRAAIHVQFLVAGGQAGQDEATGRIGVGELRAYADRHSGDGLAVHQQHLAAEAGALAGHRHRLQRAQRRLRRLGAGRPPARIGVVLARTPSAIGEQRMRPARQRMRLAAAQQRCRWPRGHARRLHGRRRHARGGLPLDHRQRQRRAIQPMQAVHHHRVIRAGEQQRIGLHKYQTPAFGRRHPRLDRTRRPHQGHGGAVHLAAAHRTREAQRDARGRIDPLVLVLRRRRSYGQRRTERRAHRTRRGECSRGRIEHHILRRRLPTAIRTTRQAHLAIGLEHGGLPHSCRHGDLRHLLRARIP